jgi:uncharacterized repeat protein (TIGR03803 family)
VLALLAAPEVAQAQGETVLYAFQGGSDGENVNSGLVVGSGGVIYGTTQVGGGGDCTTSWSNGAVVGCGIVFELTPPATPRDSWSEKILYSFKGGADGAFPETLVLGSGGVLYGTTANGGTGATAGSGFGVVFRLIPPRTTGEAWTEIVLHNFCARSHCTDGAYPGNGLLLSDGVLHGVTSGGGTLGLGTVFRLKLATTTTVQEFASLYSFAGGTDGAHPYYGVTARKSGILYGETNSGGGTSCNDGAGCGTVYQLTPPASAGNPYTETVLYAFPGGNGGANPAGILNLLPSGALLGAVGGGSFSDGAIFELKPPTTSGAAWTETILTNFDPGNLYGVPGGTFPNGGFVVGTTGSIYGTTYGGGDPNLQMGYYFPGTIFELTPPIEEGGDWVQSLLYSFQGGSDGLTPEWGLTAGPDGTLYGTTAVGGGTGCPAQAYNNMNIGCGTVFQFTP